MDRDVLVRAAIYMGIRLGLLLDAMVGLGFRLWLRLGLRSGRFRLEGLLSPRSVVGPLPSLGILPRSRRTPGAGPAGRGEHGGQRLREAGLPHRIAAERNPPKRAVGQL